MKKFIAIISNPAALAAFLMPACQSAPKVESTGDYVLQITQIDTTEFPMVNVYVSVRDSTVNRKLSIPANFSCWKTANQ